MPFPPNKTIKELEKEIGFDKTRKFVVVSNGAFSPKIGDILELNYDDDSRCPCFWNLTADRGNTMKKNHTKEAWSCFALLSQIEYYNEEKPICEETRYFTTGTCTNIQIENNKLMPTGKKLMSIITNIFKSKEAKALEKLGYGTVECLNEAGKSAFIDYIYETGSTSKKEFLDLLVKEMESEKK